MLCRTSDTSDKNKYPFIGPGFLDQWVGWSAYVRPLRGTRVVPSVGGLEAQSAIPAGIRCCIAQIPAVILGWSSV